MTTTERLPRGSYIGGHEVSAIAGLHPYMTIGDVYQRVALGITPPDIGEEPAVRRGRIVEPGFITYLEERFDLTLRRDVFVRHPSVPYWAGTVDALEERDDGLVVHELTTCTTRSLDGWGDTGTERAATYKWVQNQWYQGACGAVAGYVHLFVTDTGELRHYPIKRNDVAIEALFDDVEAFWLDHVLPKKPPVIDADAYDGERANKIATAIYPLGSDDVVIEPTPDVVELVNEYDEARRREKAAVEAKDKAAAKVKLALGEATSCAGEGGKVTWRNSKARTSIDHKAVIEELTTSNVVDPAVMRRLLGKHTTEKPGPRSLRVTIKEGKQ